MWAEKQTLETSKENNWAQGSVLHQLLLCLSREVGISPLSAGARPEGTAINGVPGEDLIWGMRTKQRASWQDSGL